MMLGDQVTVLGIDIGFRNLSLCKLVAERVLVPEPTGKIKLKISKWKNFDCLAMVKCPKTSLKKVTPKETIDICELTFEKLEEIFNQFADVNHVIIESQPQGKYVNIKMHTMQTLLYSHFRRKFKLQTFPYTLKSVQLVAAASKYSKSLLDKFDLVKQPNYHNRKNLSVRLASLLLAFLEIEFEPDSFRTVSTKKDDLADSFLLAISFVLQYKPYKTHFEEGRGDPLCQPPSLMVCMRGVQTKESAASADGLELYGLSEVNTRPNSGLPDATGRPEGTSILVETGSLATSKSQVPEGQNTQLITAKRIIPIPTTKSTQSGTHKRVRSFDDASESSTVSQSNDKRRAK